MLDLLCDECREHFSQLQQCLTAEGIPYLAPEMCLLYKSTDIERDGYQQDFELAWKAMDPSRREWLRKALLREYPNGHPWLDMMRTEGANPF